MNKTTEELIIEISSYGSFVMHKFDSGCWHCHVTLPSPKGTTFECKSRYDHKTYREALLACLENIPINFKQATIVVEKYLPEKESYSAGYIQAFDEATSLLSGKTTTKQIEDFSFIY